MELLHAAFRAIEVAVGWVFSPEWLPPTDFKLLKWLVIPGFGYGIVYVMFGVGELIWPAARRPWSRKSLLSVTYLLLAGKLGFYTLIVAPAMRKAWLYLGLPSLHLDERLPLPVYAVVAVLVVTFISYWAHRTMHRVPLFWHVHKIHHSIENLNYSSVYQMHFLEYLLETPLHLVGVLLLGTNLVAPFGIIFKFVDVFGHANVRINSGWLTYIISTPEAHRVHHSSEPRHYSRNFGNTFMWWDHLFGTFSHDPKHPATTFGLPEPVPASFWKQQLLPFVWIARDVRAGVGRRLTARVAGTDQAE
jgi:sterol desaturase/sphingolipid hydroxylase (fatty acid hydroxylase superfamily)